MNAHVIAYIQEDLRKACLTRNNYSEKELYDIIWRLHIELAYEDYLTKRSPI